jgi:hypothetical protein
MNFLRNLAKVSARSDARVMMISTGMLVAGESECLVDFPRSTLFFESDNL